MLAKNYSVLTLGTLKDTKDQRAEYQSVITPGALKAVLGYAALISLELKNLQKEMAYSLQRRNRSAPLVPPKPKEFDMAYSSLALREWLGTKSIPAVPGS